MDTKTKRRTPPREPGYHRLTDEKRIIIETLRKEGRSLAYIAERIGCSKSTVSKEIKRNKSKRGYRHKKANGQARARVAAKAAKRRKFTPEMWDYAITHLRDDGWTFEQSCGRARRDGIPMVCKETLYKEYYRRQMLVMQGKSKEDLPPLPKRRKQRKTRDRNAKPYHSWERGTNENRNGIVRMVLPKGRSFEDILNAELERIDHLLNDRPMKCLDWRTPREAHNALLRRHALADAA